MPPGNSDSNASSVLKCNIPLICLSTIAIGIRLYTRLVIKKAIGLDDFLETENCSCSDIMAGTKFGLGYHFVAVSEGDFITFRKIQFLMQLSYIASFVASKLSFAALYLRVFPEQLFRRIIVSLSVLLVAEYIEETVVICLQCRPIQKLWQPTIDGSCMDLRTFYYVAFAVKLATDLTLFLLPIPALQRLQTSLGKKIGVLAMFSLGLLVCVISVIRAPFLSKIDADITYSLVMALNWSSIEICSLLVCSCIPSLRPFLRQFPAVSSLLRLSTRSTASRVPDSNEQAYDLVLRNPKKSRSPYLRGLSTLNSTQKADGDSREVILQTERSTG
ncbi:hypothetical protein B0J12DRAFT_608243 [Macrophomina phaseolina]|uniref:Rhodopsin domain-containing protein n=1 Tax=Macrophomina phaseolina TaxID=35725 RepID=A0ABQ8FWW6_9PEZI|nr:hypothetical protein B0J12DRAFT_608243 [Macrophomina phaseolina]